MLAGDVEIPGSGGTRGDSDADVQREAEADGEEGQALQVHRSVLVDAMLAVEPVHADGVEEDQHQEGEYRALLREPETERVAADVELVEKVHQQDATAAGDRGPDRQSTGDQPQIGLPIGLPVVVHVVPPPLFLWQT